MKRSTGETVVWEDVYNSNDEAIERLNGFIGLRKYVDENDHDFQVMPYTPAAANFFTNLLLGLARLVMNVDDFFADKKRVKAAIEAGAPFMLMGPTESKPTKKGRKQ